MPAGAYTTRKDLVVSEVRLNQARGNRCEEPLRSITPAALSLQSARSYSSSGFFGTCR